MNQVRLKTEVKVGRTSPRRRAGRDIDAATIVYAALRSLE